ncbi:glycosyltransferase family 4 protein [Microbacterium sp. YY-01]|uniref:glycosyltransferase family 4 protein n=1 Tax=Microbacterium sp. YY-01 TaxID=3421634 RepID=UPI003D168448
MFETSRNVTQSLGYRTRSITSNMSRNPASYVFSIRNLLKVRRELRQHTPRVIHVHNYYHYLSPSILWAISRYKNSNPNVRVVFTAHDYHLICPNSGLQYFKNGQPVNYSSLQRGIKWYHSFDRRSRVHSSMKALQHFLAYTVLKLDRVFDRIITPSELIKETFINWGIRAPIYLVRNPVDVGPPTGSPGEGLVALTRLHAEKGLAEFIQALEAERYQCSLDIYGDGPERSRLNEIGLTCEYVKVNVHGHVAHADVPEILSKHRALVYPSTWLENAPIALIEAAQRGLSLVVPKIGGVYEMASLAANVNSYDPTKPNEIRNAVESALHAQYPNYILEPADFSIDAYAQMLKTIYTR